MRKPVRDLLSSKTKHSRDMVRKRVFSIWFICTAAISILLAAWLAFARLPFATAVPVSSPSGPVRLLPHMTSRDRVLVVAPHPDDECIATGGLIQQAHAAGARVHVVYLTYGDNHELAYWALRKVPALTPSQYRALAQTRHGEALSGMQSLGISRSDLTFLGYPDAGTLRIWETTWKQGSSRYHLATGTRVVPYRDALSPGSPYNASAVIADFESVIRSFGPTIVMFPSPLDLNPDHQAAYLYVTAALHDLGANPEQYTYLVHQRHFPIPRLYSPSAILAPPSFVTSLPVALYTLPLSTPETQRKYRATLLYRSQTDVSYGLLASFARRNELFLADDHLRLSTEAIPFFLIPTDFMLQKFGRNFELRSLTASKPTPTNLRLVLRSPAAPSADSVAIVSIFPVADGIPFAEQPKIVVTLQHGQQADVVDLVSGSSLMNHVTTTDQGTSITIDIDIPEAARASLLMLHVEAGYRGLDLYSTPWQVFRIPQGNSTSWKLDAPPPAVSTYRMPLETREMGYGAQCARTSAMSGSSEIG